MSSGEEEEVQEEKWKEKSEIMRRSTEKGERSYRMIYEVNSIN